MAKGLEHLSCGGCLRELWLLSMENSTILQIL